MFSSQACLVFEYLEGDLEGIIKAREIVLSAGDIKSYIKCGIFDIPLLPLFEKTANILSSRLASLVSVSITPFTRMLLEGLDHLHRNWILHRDLKPGQ